MTNANETQSFSSLDNTGIAENDLVHDDVMSVFLVIRHGTPAQPAPLTSATVLHCCPTGLAHNQFTSEEHIAWR